jgi:hypothetical protein
MFDDEIRTPTYLWVEAKLRELSDKAVGVYVAHRGEKMGGLVLLKLDNLEGQCRLLTQQRNLDGVLEWVDVYQENIIDNKKADDYITRSVQRDPDVWVIEIEDKEMTNPFPD